MANDWKTNYNPLQAALPINLNKIQPEHSWPLRFLAIKHIQISDLSYNKGALRKELRNFICLVVLVLEH